MASLTVALTVEPAASDADALAEALAHEAVARGWAIDSGYTVEVQANWISGGFDLTARAYVTRARVARSACAAHTGNKSL